MGAGYECKEQERIQWQKCPLEKRVLDVTLCLFFLPVILPLMAILCFLIFIDSRGPVVFIQERVGRGGHRFNMYKLRTMHNNVDLLTQQAYMRAFVRGETGGEPVEGTIHKPPHDSQVTRLGRVLRKTSLDEVPQLLNVLMGQMSLVGPRPNLLWEVEEYQPWHKRRLTVLPGITGLAQVRGRSQLSFDRIVEYDIEYIENQNLLLDIKILFLTILNVLSVRGAR
jgi:lipopolysaccharide/colanic/teichoic acid biosynthesis glycosyltransferase